MIEKKQKIRLDEIKIANQLEKSQLRILVGGYSTANNLTVAPDDPLLAGCCPTDPHRACNTCQA